MRFVVAAAARRTLWLVADDGQASVAGCRHHHLGFSGDIGLSSKCLHRRRGAKIKGNANKHDAPFAFPFWRAWRARRLAQRAPALAIRPKSASIKWLSYSRLRETRCQTARGALSAANGEAGVEIGIEVARPK